MLVLFAAACSGDRDELAEVAVPSTTSPDLESTTSIQSSTTSTTAAPARVVAEPATVEAPDAAPVEHDDSDGVETCLLYTSPSPRDRG